MPKAPAISADEMSDTDAPELPQKQSADTVLVMVTKFGEGKVSTGVHVPIQGDVMAKRGEIIEVSKTVGRALESLGLGEIQE